MSSYLTDKQVEILLRAINPSRVGHDEKGFAHVEAHDIKAHLNRIFGFGRWGWEDCQTTILHTIETKTNAGKDAWYVIAMSSGYLTVSAPDGTSLGRYYGVHRGASTHPTLDEAIGGALVNSDSFAIKRAAICLGDQMGLSLYAKGSTSASVKQTLVPGLPTEEKPQEGEKPATVALPTQSVQAPIAPLEAAPVEVNDSAPSVLALREQILALIDSPPEGKVARIKARHDMLLRLQHLGWESAPTTDEAGESVTLAALVERISA